MGTRQRPWPSKFDVERAVIGSDLPLTAKALMFVILAWCQAQGPATIPEGHARSLNEIALAVSADRSTVTRYLNLLERDGWLYRKRPSRSEARSGARTRYCLDVPDVLKLEEPQVSPRCTEHLPLGAQNTMGRPAETSGVGAQDTRGRCTVHQKTTINQNKKKHSYTEEFERFWAAYPRRQGKTAAAQKFAIARREVSLETILLGAKHYSVATEATDRRFICLPATWLHQGRWDDELPEPHDDVDEWLQ